MAVTDYHLPDADISGLEGARQLIAGMRATFPDFYVTTEDVLADGDKVAIRFTDSGTYQGGEFGAAAQGYGSPGQGPTFSGS
jgi:predicted ester cyclase